MASGSLSCCQRVRWGDRSGEDQRHLASNTLVLPWVTCTVSSNEPSRESPDGISRQGAQHLLKQCTHCIPWLCCPLPQTFPHHSVHHRNANDLILISSPAFWRTSSVYGSHALNLTRLIDPVSHRLTHYKDLDLLRKPVSVTWTEQFIST